jgi:hypothetical protein
MAVRGLERLAVCFGHRQTGHRHRLAPQGLSSVLDLESPPRSTGAAVGGEDVRELIRRMSRENPLWGAPRIHGELLKLGIDIGETSVGKYVEPRLVHNRRAVDLGIGTEEDCGTKDSLEGRDEPPILRTTLLHSEGVQHVGGARECAC